MLLVFFSFLFLIILLDVFDISLSAHISAGSSSAKIELRVKCMKKNANNTKLAWVYEPKDKTKYTKNIQANPIYFDGSIYTPNSINQIISLNPKDGSENWVFDAKDGIADGNLIFLIIDQLLAPIIFAR